MNAQKNEFPPREKNAKEAERVQYPSMRGRGREWPLRLKKAGWTPSREFDFQARRLVSLVALYRDDSLPCCFHPIALQCCRRSGLQINRKSTRGCGQEARQRTVKIFSTSHPHLQQTSTENLPCAGPLGIPPATVIPPLPGSPLLPLHTPPLHSATETTPL